MKQYRNTGFWYVDIEEFRRLLDIPEKYIISKIDEKVLKPIKEELKKYNLKVEKKYKSSGVRPKVVAFNFKFDKEKIKDDFDDFINKENLEQYINLEFKKNYENTIYTCTMTSIRLTRENLIYFEYVDNLYCYGENVLTINEFKSLVKYKEI
ncbi:hypothetical protein [Pseudostreptobacillus hongkongensis]|uniref:replication initiation protein n=1 Tax=Pseudostreptobacillus hongkongensis TaxID=1162717 RepID=UPI0036F2F1F1